MAADWLFLFEAYAQIGVSLSTLINYSGQAIVSVIGTDMSRFPSDRHLCAWAGICPGNNESAGKRKSGRLRKGNSLLRSTLVICAHSAVKCKSSYFYAQFQRIRARRGNKRAYAAVAHSMLIAIYHILNDGVEFKDLGADYYNQFNRERKINAYLKKLKALGWDAQNSENRGAVWGAVPVYEGCLYEDDGKYKRRNP